MDIVPMKPIDTSSSFYAIVFIEIIRAMVVVLHRGVSFFDPMRPGSQEYRFPYN